MQMRAIRKETKAHINIKFYNYLVLPNLAPMSTLQAHSWKFYYNLSKVTAQLFFQAHNQNLIDFLNKNQPKPFSQATPKLVQRYTPILRLGLTFSPSFDPN